MHRRTRAFRQGDENLPMVSIDLSDIRFFD
jgi:hypothetical protein